MITTITILSVLLLVALYVIWNLLRKVERLEDTANELGDFLYKASEVVQSSNERLRELDKKGSFESDDEIGFFFKAVKDIQEVLNAININE